MDVCCESLEAAGASMRPSGSSPAARPPLRHRRRPALAGEGPSLARPTPSLASPPLAGEAHALASEGPSPARVKALAGEAPRQRGPSPRWRGCPRQRQRGPRPRQRERVRFLMSVCGLWRAACMLTVDARRGGDGSSGTFTHHQTTAPWYPQARSLSVRLYISHASGTRADVRARAHAPVSTLHAAHRGYTPKAVHI